MLVWLHVFLVRLQGKIRDERFLAPLVSMYNLPPRGSNSFCKIRRIGDFYCQENHLTYLAQGRSDGFLGNKIPRSCENWDRRPQRCFIAMDPGAIEAEHREAGEPREPRHVALDLAAPLGVGLLQRRRPPRTALRSTLQGNCQVTHAQHPRSAVQ